jgi:putative cell wall-binding protein
MRSNSLGRRASIAALFTAMILAFSLAQPVVANAVPTAIVQGVVTAPAGMDLAGGVTVRLYTPINDWNVLGTATADPTTGAYSIAAEPGTYTLKFSYGGTSNILNSYLGAAFRVDQGTTFTTNSSVPTVVNYQLPRGGTMSGVILGEGAVTGSVSAQVSDFVGNSGVDGNGGLAYDQTTGSYTFTRVQPGTYTLTLCSPGFTCETAQAVVALGADVSVGTTDLANTHTLSGTVTAAAGGAAISGIDVYLLNAPGFPFFYEHTNTAADGTYSFVDLSDGTYVVCFGAEYLSAYVNSCWGGPTAETATPIALTADKANVNAVIKKAGKITGTVKWRNIVTNAVSILDGAEVTLIDVDDPYNPDPLTVHTDSAGKFVFDHLQAGTYIARVRWTAEEPWLNTEYWNDAWFIQAADPVVVTGDDTDALGTIELTERTLVSARLSGADRFSTAVSISQALFPQENPSVPVVYIANAYNFPDALAAGPAAAHQGGVLLTTAPDSLPAAIAEEIERLNPDKVVIAGGVAAVNNSVQNAIRAIVGNSNVVRLAGANRFDTGRMIVEYAFGGETTPYVYIATGLNYPDALSAGPAAVRRGSPVVLVDGTGGPIDQATRNLLADLDPYQVIIAGGASAVNPTVKNSIDAVVDGSSFQIAGYDRYDTSNLINAEVFGPGSGVQYDVAFVAVGTNFADALAGGPLAGDWRSPLYLSPGNCLNPGVIDGMLTSEANLMVMLGGPAALGANVENFNWCQ